MMLYLQEKVRKLRITMREFFQTAYMWKFGKVYTPDRDILEYEAHGLIPFHVREYLKELQRDEIASMPK